MILDGAGVVLPCARARERTWRRRTDVAPRPPAAARPRGAAGCIALAFSLVTGAGDLGGNAFFVLAARADALSVAVVLSSLYPVVTTMLAALFLRERLRPLQIVGVVLASLSVPLLPLATLWPGLSPRQLRGSSQDQSPASEA